VDDNAHVSTTHLRQFAKQVSQQSSAAGGIQANLNRIRPYVACPGGDAARVGDTPEIGRLDT
jgi:hypothetical protein